MKPIAIALVLWAAAAGAHAAQPDASTLVAGLSGRWVGSLSYRDYQSDKTETLPMVAEIHALPDNATVLTISRFQDGFKVGIVTITDLALFDDRTATVAVASARRLHPVTIDTSATSVAFTDLLHWTITYTSEGRDDDKPATLKVTQTRDGDRLTAVKDVRFKDPGATWIQRNTSELRRDSGAAPAHAKPAK